jgi:hypothetical protein
MNGWNPGRGRRRFILITAKACPFINAIATELGVWFPGVEIGEDGDPGLSTLVLD